jgi:hypothetical protein
MQNPGKKFFPGFETVEKLTFSEQSLARNHAFERIPKKNRALTGTFFLPLYKFRDTCSRNL